MERIITKITPPKLFEGEIKLKRVAAYARVTDGKDAMLHSLSAQVSYYSGYIQKRRDWEYAGVFVDEAVTGTKEARAGFQDMLAACRAGKVDMVITKAISRFARNTVTLLETVRELKARGIDVYFEQENIHSISEEGELLLTLLASFAQEQSRAVSEDCKWRIRKRFEAGIPNGATMLGYRYQDDGLVIVPEEAAIVQMIFNAFLSGMGRTEIIKKLTAMGAKTRCGGDWHISSIYTILRNATYTGDLLLQKTYITDHISKKTKINHGEKPMYFVEDGHEPIIDKITFQRVQDELARRAAHYYPSKKPMQLYPFSGKITCLQCGKHYRRKVTAARPFWICATFNQFGKAACPSKQIPEQTLLAVTAEVLGLPDFDEAAFDRQIKEIQIPGFNRLVFVFHNGRTVEREWQDRSRRERWNEDMKQAARDRQLEINRRRDEL